MKGRSGSGVECSYANQMRANLRGEKSEKKFDEQEE